MGRGATILRHAFTCSARGSRIQRTKGDGGFWVEVVEVWRLHAEMQGGWRFRVKEDGWHPAILRVGWDGESRRLYIGWDGGSSQA